VENPIGFILSIRIAKKLGVDRTLPTQLLCAFTDEVRKLVCLSGQTSLKLRTFSYVTLRLSPSLYGVGPIRAAMRRTHSRIQIPTFIYNLRSDDFRNATHKTPEHRKAGGITGSKYPLFAYTVKPGTKVSGAIADRNSTCPSPAVPFFV